MPLKGFLTGGKFVLCRLIHLDYVWEQVFGGRGQADVYFLHLNFISAEVLINVHFMFASLYQLLFAFW